MYIMRLEQKYSTWIVYQNKHSRLKIGVQLAHYNVMKSTENLNYMYIMKSTENFSLSYRILKHTFSKGP